MQVGIILGQGSFAKVRLAIDQRTKEKVAIKIYDKFRLLDNTKKKNVLREITTMEKMKHPNII